MDMESIPCSLDQSEKISDRRRTRRNHGSESSREASEHKASSQPRSKPSKSAIKIDALVTKAIKALKEPDGCGLAQIKKYMSSKLNINTAAVTPQIKNYLKKATTDGILSQEKGKFKVERRRRRKSKSKGRKKSRSPLRRRSSKGGKKSKKGGKKSKKGGKKSKKGGKKSKKGGKKSKKGGKKSKKGGKKKTKKGGKKSKKGGKKKAQKGGKKKGKAKKGKSRRRRSPQKGGR